MKEQKKTRREKAQEEEEKKKLKEEWRFNKTRNMKTNEEDKRWVEKIKPEEMLRGDSCRKRGGGGGV